MGNGSGGEYITRYEAEKMMTAALKEYEREVVEPRHVETQSSLTEIKNLVQRGAGAAWMAGIFVSIASAVWVVIQIKQAVAH